MNDAADALRTIAAWPAVDEALTEAREACTRLRWHEGLRRRAPEAAAESRVRGARASAEMDGARSDDAVVRGLLIGAVEWPERPDPTLTVLRGAMQATAEAEHIGRLVTSSPRQALARLHTAAAEPLLGATPDLLGRPRRGEGCPEFSDLGEPLAHVDERLAGVASLLSCAGTPGIPVVLVAALAHAEIAVVRPFVRGNGLVARALERALIHAGGVDPTGVSVPEAGHLRRVGTPYLGALAAYADGSREGIELWVRHVAGAVRDGAAEGERIATEVRAGRLDAGA
ncbi:Fic family protein [Mobilicoccus massiliensis]|uniref:Fic family protein n=1 Tax=Mobilicoccus massiliensis TaxID=1522310 RepID=UPI00058AF88E|nr:Fic family protein [Mobilicoccus massiliensis]